LQCSNHLDTIYSALLSSVAILHKARSIWPNRTWQLEQSKSNPVLLWSGSRPPSRRTTSCSASAH